MIWWMGVQIKYKRFGKKILGYWSVIRNYGEIKGLGKQFGWMENNERKNWDI